MAIEAPAMPRLSALEEPLWTWDFTTFLNSAREFGLPITLLQKLKAIGWNCVVDEKLGASQTPLNVLQFAQFGLKRIHLSAQQVRRNPRPSKDNASIGTGIIYHEFTHAFLWEVERSASLNRILDWDACMRYYKGPSLEGGRTPFYTELVLHESAADYVGSTITEFVALMLEVQSVNRGFAGAGRELKNEDDRRKVMELAFQRWFEFLDEDTFGAYAGGIANDGEAITRPIHPKLRAFLDEQMLENLRQRGAAMATALRP